MAKEFLEHWLLGEWYDEKLYRELYPTGIRSVVLTDHIRKRVGERISKKIGDSMIFQAIDRGLRMHEIKNFSGLTEYCDEKRKERKNHLPILYQRRMFIFCLGVEKDPHGLYPVSTFITCLELRDEHGREFDRAWKELRKNGHNPA